VRIAAAAFAPYALALRRPLEGRAAQASRREGFVLAVTDGEGRVGYGEAAPLAGLHVEGLPEVERALVALCPALAGASLEEEGAMPEVPAAASLASLPSVRFAWEMAALGLLARARGAVPCALLTPTPHAQVPIQGLLARDESPAEIARPGVPLKVKVGRSSPERDRERLLALLARLPADVPLRIDANRALDLDAATRLFEGLPAERIEYVEEPLRDPSRLGEFARRTGLHVALDETLGEPSGADLLAHPAVRALVLKPSVLGGFGRAHALADSARRAGRTCVVSSAFESGLGLEALAQFACAVNDTPVAAGLGTDRWLAQDLRDPPFDSSSGRTEARDWRGAPAAAWLRQSGLSATEVP